MRVPRFASPSPLVLVALFASGAAGLIDQLVWVRRAALTFGATTYALTTVLMVFFLGLALGGAGFAGVATRTDRPLRLTAGLELALAVLVLLTLPAFGWVDAAFGAAYRAFPAQSMALALVRAALAALVVLPPAVLMGGTLPLIARAAVRDQRVMGGDVARLYAVNTLGASLGAAVAGFMLVPRFGLRASLAAAAVLNVIAAALLARCAAGEGAAEADARGGARADLPRHLPARTSPGASPGAPARSPLAGPRVVGARDLALVGALLFATGFVALGQEVLWARFLVLVVRSSVTSVALTLSLTLLGIVAGSLLVGRVVDRLRDRGFALGALQIASALAVVWLVHLPPEWWRGLGGELATAAVLLLPAAILSGAAFPLATRIVIESPSASGGVLGRLLAANTLGGIVGAGLVGFVLLPGVGLDASARVLTATGLATGVAAWLTLDRARPLTLRAALAGAAVVAWLAIPASSGTRLPADFLASRGQLIDHREGVEANLAVVRGAEGERALEMDRWWQGRDLKTHQIMAAHLPMLLHPRPRRVLVVGVGAGQTPARFAMYPIERLDAVDIEPRVFDVLRADFLGAWLGDPRVRLLPLDGRNHIAHASERYDLVSLEVGQLFRPGVASFYSREFYAQVRSRLAPGGIVSQFVPLAFLTPDLLRGVIATFLAEFPHATLWYNTSELLLIAGRDALPRLDPARLAAALADTTIAADLAWSHWGGPREWLSRPVAIAALYLAGPRGLAALANGGAIFRDDPPTLEYAARNLSTDAARDAALAPLIVAALDPIAPAVLGAPPGDVDARRAANLADLRAAPLLRALERARAANDIGGAERLAREATLANPRNLVAQRLLGDALVLLERPDDAESSYVRALGIDPGDARTHAGLGYLRLRAGAFAAAIPHLRAALARNPDDGELRNNLGAALARTGDYPGALEQFDRAVALRPDDLGARDNAAKLRAAMGAPPPRGGPGARPGGTLISR